MTLGELISTLKRKDPATRVMWDFCTLRPKIEISSYRGFYDQLAIGYGTYDETGEVLVGGLLERLQACVGKTFTGYKGGEYKMNESTQVWCSNYGEASGYLIVDVIDDDSYAIRLKVARVD